MAYIAAAQEGLEPHIFLLVLRTSAFLGGFMPTGHNGPLGRKNGNRALRNATQRPANAVHALIPQDRLHQGFMHAFYPLHNRKLPLGDALQYR
ncbi:hypothetical protein SDC9_163847 [bioreactor metagenome]|uniref:Uncharacterized protein n=1 Tax=bioreactor metagenome TaxID=1076179 RepID=A0A645FX60_9ZZZZ